MITFAVESWSQLRPDIEQLIEGHWKEIARHHEDVPLDPAWDKYQELADSGALHCVTGRKDGKLIAYQLTIITSHLHYKSTLHGITDIYYLLPEYRKGYTGIDMFRFVEAALRERGVKVLMTATKKHLDISSVFLRLRYEPVETLFKKVLK